MSRYIFIIICFIICGHIKGQMVNDKVKIKVANGNIVIGTVEDLSDTELIIKTDVGTLTIQKENIQEITIGTETQEIDSKGYPIDYHNSTHYLVNPSGFTLKKGQSYYENIGVFFNTYAHGVTDRFTIAVGGEIASPLFFQELPIMYISPRFSIPIGKNANSLSVGGTLFTIPYDGGEAFGILQGAFTLGSRNDNFTIGSGIGFSFSQGFTDSVLPFYFSFMTRISKKISIVSDNFMIAYNNFDDTTGLLSLAMRIHFNKVGSAFNIGLFRSTEDWGDVLALPFVSATIAIGK